MPSENKKIVLKMKAVIYSRVSTEGQDYQRQTEDLVKYANAMGYELICEPLEEKESGFNDERPLFKKLCQLDKKDVDIVLVWELTRLSRKSIKLQETVRMFMDKGIRVYAYKDNFCTHNPDGTENSFAKLLLSLLATIAEEEAKTLKARTKAGRTFNVVHKGHSHTTKPLFGYDLVDGKLQINEEEAKMVRKLFQMCIEGKGFRAMTLYMRSVDGKHQWKNGAMAGLFKNTTYMGKRMWEGKYEVATPQIVTEEIWEKAQDAIQGRRKNRSLANDKGVEPYFLRGLLECSNCGRKFTHSNHIYKCVTNVNRDYERCGSTTIQATTLDAAIWNMVSVVYKEQINAEYLAEKKKPIEDEISVLVRDADRLVASKGDKQKETEKEYKVAVRFVDSNPQLYEMGMDRIKVLTDEMNAIDKEIELIASKIHTLQKKLSAIDEGSTYEIKEETEKREFIHKAIEKIVVYGNRSQKILQVFFKMGAIYDLVYYKKTWYYFKNDGCVKYTDTKKLKKANPDIEVEDTLIEVTTTNNGMFGEEVLGGYTFDNYMGILQMHQLLTVAYEVYSLV